MNKIHGKSILVRVSARFEWERGRVIGIRLYFNFPHYLYVFRSTVSSTSQCSINSPFLRNNNLQLSSSSGGTLRSPSYPSNYPNNMMCTWKITAPSGSRLRLTFNYFGLESGTCSTKDYLEVRDGSSSTSTRKGTYCGSYAPSMTSSGRYHWIRFPSDSSVTYKGFEARYTILTQPSKYPHFSVATYSVCCGTPETSNGSVPFAVQSSW